jgi:hypothetical protein
MEQEDRPSWGSATSAYTTGIHSGGGAKDTGANRVHDEGSSMLPELVAPGGYTSSMTKGMGGAAGKRASAPRDIGVAFGRTWSHNKRAGSAGSQGSAGEGRGPQAGAGAGTEGSAGTLQETSGRAIARLPSLPSFVREMRTGITPAGMPALMAAPAPLPSMRLAPIPAK